MARFAYIERRVGFGRLLGKELPFYMTDQKIISIACSFHFWFRFSTECFDQCLATELMDTSYCSSFRVSNFMTHHFLLLTLIYLFFFYCSSFPQYGLTLLPTFTTHARFHIDHISFRVGHLLVSSTYLSSSLPPRGSVSTRQLRPRVGIVHTMVSNLLDDLVRDFETSRHV